MDGKLTSREGGEGAVQKGVEGLELFDGEIVSRGHTLKGRRGRERRGWNAGRGGQRSASS